MKGNRIISIMLNFLWKALAIPTLLTKLLITVKNENAFYKAQWRVKQNPMAIQRLLHTHTLSFLLILLSFWRYELEIYINYKNFCPIKLLNEIINLSFFLSVCLPFLSNVSFANNEWRKEGNNEWMEDSKKGSMIG